eukprot:137099-Lingulodinium_polyedra.AAC.1
MRVARVYMARGIFTTQFGARPVYAFDHIRAQTTFQARARPWLWRCAAYGPKFGASTPSIASTI